MVTRVGTDGDDYLAGDFFANDQLEGLWGNDTLVGLGGTDRLIGAEGNDLLIPDGRQTYLFPSQIEGDTVDGGSGEDTVSVDDVFFGGTASIDLANGLITGPYGDYVRLVSVEHVIGAAVEPNLILGSSGNNVIVGGIAADSISGGDGADTIAPRFNGAPDTGDWIDAGPGFDLVVLPFPRADALVRQAGAGFDVLARTPGAVHHYLVLNAEVFAFGDQALTIRAEDLLDGPGDLDGDPYFDSTFYLATYADVRAAGIDPLLHYHDWGWREGRDPSALFDTRGYLALNPDVAAAGINPLDHYRAYGWREDRDPDAAFDLRRYLDANPDVRRAGLDPLGHYLTTGIWEKRPVFDALGTAAADGFDRVHYLLANHDVAASRLDPARHFNDFGWREGRDPNAFFDTTGYLAHNPDVAAAGLNPLTHYAGFGWREGRDPSTQFDTTRYLEAYADVARAGVDPLVHYLNFGIYEGRLAFGDNAWT